VRTLLARWSWSVVRRRMGDRSWSASTLRPKANRPRSSAVRRRPLGTAGRRARLARRGARRRSGPGRGRRGRTPPARGSASRLARKVLGGRSPLERGARSNRVASAHAHGVRRSAVPVAAVRWRASCSVPSATPCCTGRCVRSPWPRAETHQRRGAVMRATEVMTRPVVRVGPENRCSGGDRSAYRAQCRGVAHGRRR
jgi:hypothetical protein